MANKLEITLTRSVIGRPEDQRETVNSSWVYVKCIKLLYKKIMLRFAV